MSTTNYAVIHFFPGGTAANYDASINAVHPGEGVLPDGQIFHAAGPSERGWTIFAVHETQESWESFRDNVLIPRMQEGIEGGFPTPPTETVVDLYNIVS